MLTFLCPQGDPRPSRFLNYFKKNNIKCDIFYNTQNIQLKSRKNAKSTIHYFYYKFIKYIIIIVKILSKILPFKKYLYQFLISFQYGHIVPKYSYRVEYDYILVEDIFLLFFAFNFNDKCRVIFDAREFYPKQREDIIFKILHMPIYHYMCQKYLPLCHAVFTVSESLKKEYKKIYSVNAKLLYSVPHSGSNYLKKTSRNNIKLIHHGIANRNRKLENMIEIAKRLDERFSVHFRLTGSNQYISDLKKLSKTVNNVFFEDPVPLGEITSMLNQYDIGFYYLEPNGFNLKNCLPNKFFEFIHGKLAIVIGPSSDMARIVSENNCGFVADEFSINSMVDLINGLDHVLVDQAKSNSHELSKSLCWEIEQNKLKSIFI